MRLSPELARPATTMWVRLGPETARRLTSVNRPTWAMAVSTILARTGRL